MTASAASVASTLRRIRGRVLRDYSRADEHRDDRAQPEQDERLRISR